MRQDYKLVETLEFIPESSILNILIDANRWWDLPARSVPNPPTKKKHMITASSVLVQLGAPHRRGGSVGVTPLLAGSSGSAWRLEAKRLLRVAQRSAASSGWLLGWCPLSAAAGHQKHRVNLPCDTQKQLMSHFEHNYTIFSLLVATFWICINI